MNYILENMHIIEIQCNHNFKNQMFVTEFIFSIGVFQVLLVIYTYQGWKLGHFKESFPII